MFRTFFNRRRAGADRLGARRQRGVTLIEVMIALVLTSILVLGLSGLWANVSRQFLFLTLKQKAVFVLNGEMERLSALYRFGWNLDTESPAGFDEVGDYCVVVGLEEVERFIYPDIVGPPVDAEIVTTLGEIVTTADAEFVCVEPTLDIVCAGRVLYALNADGDIRNYVWIDQFRNVTAEVSWCLQDLAAANSAFCSAGTTPAGDGTATEVGGEEPCQKLTVFLEFPFRYTDVANPDSDAGKRETLTLITIVGRRP